MNILLLNDKRAELNNKDVFEDDELQEDGLDTVIALRKPENYSPDSGTCFEVHFDKNRGLYGDNIKPFEAHLETHLSNDGVETINWEYKSLNDSTFEKVCSLANEGLEQFFVF